MDDTISRQAAIELIERMKSYHQDADDIAEMIANMPSAQPELSGKIERILDFLDTELHPIVSPEHWDVYSELHDMISMLSEPSAQPSIAEKLYQYKCYITDKEGLQHEVIHTGDIRRVTGWEI